LGSGAAAIGPPSNNPQANSKAQGRTDLLIDLSPQDRTPRHARGDKHAYRGRGRMSCTLAKQPCTRALPCPRPGSDLQPVPKVQRRAHSRSHSAVRTRGSENCVLRIIRARQVKRQAAPHAPWPYFRRSRLRPGAIERCDRSPATP
jgi:hypothetical protein